MNYKWINKKIKNNDALGKSMLLSMLCKPVGMIISLVYTPLLLGYLGEEAYGLWATILSVVNWINYFDVGIGNGLRNELAKNVSTNDSEGSNQAVSTAYVLISFISSIVLVFGCVAINMLDCNSLFNTKIDVKPALAISFVFICINFVLALSKVQLFATQQADKVGLMTVFIQVLNLIGIVILRIWGNGNIITVAILVGVSSLLVNILFTGKVWKDHCEFIPKINSFKKNKVSAIGNLGIKFFIIQIAALVLYTTDNMIITRLFGPSNVTPYQTAYTAFGVVNGLFAAFISPLWSEYTIATEKGNYQWIESVVFKLNFLLIPVGIVLGIGTFFFKTISEVWLHKILIYDEGLIPLMAVYFFMYVWGSIYSNVLNGMGKVDLQMFLAVVTTIVNIPLSVFLGRNMGMGSTGVLLATIICMAASNIPSTIYTHKYIGLMNKKN